MTTLTINIDDHTAERLKVSARGLAVDKLAERIIVSYFALPKAERIDHDSSCHKHEELCGIFSQGADINQLREDYIKEKYGL